MICNVAVAKSFQNHRLDFMQKVWNKDSDLQAQGFYTDDRLVEKAIHTFDSRIESAPSVTDLLTAEAQFTKQLYAYAAQKHSKKTLNVTLAKKI